MGIWLLYCCAISPVVPVLAYIDDRLFDTTGYCWNCPLVRSSRIVSFHGPTRNGKGVDCMVKESQHVQSTARRCGYQKSDCCTTKKKVKLEEKNILIQIIKNRRLLMYFLIMTVVWICDALIYYGISLYSTQLSGNKYINYVLLGLVEAPSNFFTPWFLKNLGRRLFISGTHFVAAISFLLLIFITNPTGALILWLIGKFGIICSFNCLYVYCSELFPTNIRNGCTGGCESVGRLFSTFAPALYSLKSIYVQLPTIVFTALAAISSGLVLCLPETKNANLPDTTADL
ncbi:hypothetical protein M3Y94_00675100 [Aphelenchoides besseyi]|nr:hypothetical protein M3Y94_00675100 [Aphelenchoides besseyi]